MPSPSPRSRRRASPAVCGTTARAEATTTPTPRVATPRRPAVTPTEATAADADADGGDAEAENDAVVKQTNESSGRSGHSPQGDCGCQSHSKDGSGSSQSNESERRAGRPEANGGNANATAVTAATPTPATPRSATATRLPSRSAATPTPRVADTTATSGDATGGDGGRRRCRRWRRRGRERRGGQAGQRVPSRSGTLLRGCGCQELTAEDGSSSSQSNESSVNQGSPEATGGNANATGGNGGRRQYRQHPEHNGNANAKSEPQEQQGRYEQYGPAVASTARAEATTTPMPRVETPRRPAAMQPEATAETPMPTVATPRPRTTRWSSRPTSPRASPRSHPHGDCGCQEPPSKDGSSSSQSNESNVEQGDPRRMAATPTPRAVTAATPIPATPRSTTATPTPSRAAGADAVRAQVSCGCDGYGSMAAATTPMPMVETPRRPAATRPEVTAETPMPTVATPRPTNEAKVIQFNLSELEARPGSRQIGQPIEMAPAALRPAGASCTRRDSTEARGGRNRRTSCRSAPPR